MTPLQSTSESGVSATKDSAASASWPFSSTAPRTPVGTFWPHLHWLSAESTSWPRAFVPRALTDMFMTCAIIFWMCLCLHLFVPGRVFSRAVIVAGRKNSTQPPLFDEAPTRLRSPSAATGEWSVAFPAAVSGKGMVVPRTPTFGVGERFPRSSSPTAGVDFPPHASTLLEQPLSSFRSPSTPTMGGTGPRLIIPAQAEAAAKRSPGFVYTPEISGVLRNVHTPTMGGTGPRLVIEAEIKRARDRSPGPIYEV